MQSLLQRLLLGNAGGGGGGNPTLNYNFVDGSAFPSAITFSRGTNATQFDSSGNLVYAPANLLLQSEAFNTTWTTSNASITANSTTAPSATTTADTLVEDTATNFHYVQQTVSGTTNTNNYTLSCFIKASTRTAARIAIIEGTTFSRQVRATVDLSAGTVVGAALNSATLTAATIQAVGNSWYRVTVAGVLGGTDTSILCAVYVGQDPATFNYAGNGTGSVFLWGAQLNPTPVLGGVTESLSTYYPTTASAYYGPRLDYDPATLAAQGLLIEEQRTNSIRNNTMQGAVAGTPGTLPTNWQSNVGGLTLGVVGTGTENGITYIDVRFSGTPTQTFANVRFEGNTQIVASNGQTWTNSFYVRRVSGSNTNITDIDNRVFYRDSGGTPTQESASSVVGLLANTALNVSKTTFTYVCSTATTAFVNSAVYLTTTVGLAIDITLRIGLPQLELGAFATSVIPTTTTALTRNADVATVSPLGSWFNSAAGTIYAEFSIPAATASRSQATFGDGTANERMIISNNTSLTGTAWRIVDGGVDQADINNNTSFANNATVKVAGAYAVNDFATSQNGGTVGTDTSGTLPTVTALYLGSNGAAQYASSHLRRITYYPVRLTNAALQQITT